MKRGLGLAGFVVAVLVMSCSASFALGTDTTRTTVQGPILGGHLYSPIAPFGLPLIRTSTQMNIGIGQTTRLRLPEVTIGDKLVIAPVGNLVVAIGALRHEQAIKDWLSVYLEFDGIGRLGTNVSSLLAQGANTALSYQLGWKVRVYETEKLSFSAGLELREGTYSTIDIKRWATGLLDSGYVTPNSQLIDTKPALSVKAPLKALWTISDAIGLYGGMDIGYAESRVRSGGPQLHFATYAVLSANWNPVIQVPIGTSIGVSYSQIPEAGEAGDGSVKNIYFRLGYTGEAAFALGAQANLQFYPIAGVTDEVTFIVTAVDIRFYF